MTIVQTPSGYRATIDGLERDIPNDPNNRHYQMVLAAIADGAEVVSDQSAPTPEQIIDAFRRAIDAHVEQQARAWQYNSAAHLASYVPSAVAQWAAEATAFVAWRDAVWLAALGLLADVQAGEAEPPAVPADFIATMPKLVRPE